MLKLVRKSAPNRSLWLVGDMFRIGAHADNDLQVTGRGVSDFHAEILIDNDALTLRGEPGRCFVNDMPVDAEHPLKPGDELRIGVEVLLIVDPKQQPDPEELPKTATTQPRRATGAWILKAEHPQLNNRRFPVRSGAVIGRSKDCGITVPYKRMSRRHAEFTVDGEGLKVKDLGSANGTFVNGEQVEEARLKAGDKVSFAQLEFTVQAPAEMEKTQIRPALNVEELLAAQRAAKESQAEELSDFDDALADHGVSAAAAAEPAQVADRGSKLIWIAFVLIVILAGAGYWWWNQ